MEKADVDKLLTYVGLLPPSDLPEDSDLPEGRLSSHGDAAMAGTSTGASRAIDQFIRLAMFKQIPT